MIKYKMTDEQIEHFTGLYNAIKGIPCATERYPGQMEHLANKVKYLRKHLEIIEKTVSAVKDIIYDTDFKNLARSHIVRVYNSESLEAYLDSQAVFNGEVIED